MISKPLNNLVKGLRERRPRSARLDRRQQCEGATNQTALVSCLVRLGEASIRHEIEALDSFPDNAIYVRKPLERAKKVHVRECPRSCFRTTCLDLPRLKLAVMSFREKVVMMLAPNCRIWPITA